MVPLWTPNHPRYEAVSASSLAIPLTLRLGVRCPIRSGMMRSDHVRHDKNTVQCADGRNRFENLQFRQPADNPVKYLWGNVFLNFTVLGGGAGGAMLEKVIDTFDDLYDRLRIVRQASPQGA